MPFAGEAHMRFDILGKPDEPQVRVHFPEPVARGFRETREQFIPLKMILREFPASVQRHVGDRFPVHCVIGFNALVRLFVLIVVSRRRYIIDLFNFVRFLNLGLIGSSPIFHDLD